MCNPALAGLAMMAVGTGVQYVGQKKAAKKLKRITNDEKFKQRGLRSRSLDQAESVVQQQSPDQLNQDSNAGVLESQVEGERAQRLVDGSGSATTSTSGQITDSGRGAARDAGRSSRNAARVGGLGEVMRRRLALLRQLGHGNAMIGEDSRRSLMRYQTDAANAGNAGAGLRMIGGLIGGGGQALTSNSAWAPVVSNSGGTIDGYDAPSLYRRRDPSRGMA